MQNRHESIIRAINNNDKKYNILTFPTHERYQSNLGKLDHVFYLYQGKGIKPWSSKYGKLPKNHILLDGSESQVKADIKFDIVLSQNKYGQYQVAKQISEYLNIPLVSIEHTLPFIQWTDKHIKNMTSMRGDIDVFISEYSIEKWKFDKNDPKVRIVEHAIDTDLFHNSTNTHSDNRVLTVANDYVNRDWCLNFSLYQKLTKNLPTNPVGDTPGFSKPAISINDLVSKYQNASVFLNTSIISPIPMSLLEAMACGCPVVTSATCQIPTIVEDGINGFCSNDEQYLKDKLIWCLEHPIEAKEIGLKARETILDRFNIDKHLNNWNNIFNEVYGRGHGY